MAEKEKTGPGFKMKPAGPLMIEHRLIERMIAVIKAEAAGIGSKGRVELGFIDTAVDFIKAYADRTHHGKEENILFRELGRKKISKEHQKTMQELIADHIYARGVVAKLLAATDQYGKGAQAALEEIQNLLNILADFYPKHIAKEDRDFFIPVMAYFSREELDAMLEEMWEFDRKMIHEKYTKVVEKFEQGK